MDYLRPNAAGERNLWQTHILDSSAGRVAGALDGVFSVPGFGLTATQQITVGSRTFRVFPNIHRANRRDWMAIEEIA
jgi:hypothetical protein